MAKVIETDKYIDPNKRHHFVVKQSEFGNILDHVIVNSRTSHKDAVYTALQINKNVKIDRPNERYIYMHRTRAEELFNSGKLRDPKGLL